MAWTAPRTWVAGELVTAALGNTHWRDNLLETAPAKATTAGGIFAATGSNAIAERIPDGATVATAQTTASTSYTDLATAGPAVTITTGASAFVWVQCHVSNAAGATHTYMGFAVSGATTIAAADARAMYFQSPNATNVVRAGICHFLDGTLTPGSNVFTAKYRVEANTGTFFNREIAASISSLGYRFPAGVP